MGFSVILAFIVEIGLEFGILRFHALVLLGFDDYVLNHVWGLVFFSISIERTQLWCLIGCLLIHVGFDNWECGCCVTRGV